MLFEFELSKLLRKKRAYILLTISQCFFANYQRHQQFRNKSKYIYVQIKITSYICIMVFATRSLQQCTCTRLFHTSQILTVQWLSSHSPILSLH